MAVVKFSSISFSGIKNEIERFLRNEHNKAGILFSPASPYGQILSVVENLHQMSILYLKNAINQFDLSTPNSNNRRIIRTAAILAGHNPGRSISATGTLRLSLKSNVDVDEDVPGGRITFNNKALLRNKTNSLDYSLQLGTETVTHLVTPGYTFFLPIIQGQWKTRTFTGTGFQLQTLEVVELGQKDIENFYVEVIVDGDLWVIKKHIWEMIPDEKACVVRTGFNGGIDIVFGNGAFGAIPDITSVIEVNYLTSDGSRGNIFRRTRDDFNFVDDVIDGFGETINVSKIFNVDIFNDINFGSDEEDILFTKNVLPYSSNNFVLGLPQQYAYEIKKLGVFSHVNAYERSGTIFIVATPNIRLFKNQNANYFTVDKQAFLLDRYEISKIDKFLKIAGTLQLTRKYKIESPKLSHYSMNIYVIPYSDATDDSVQAQIYDKISEYFLDLKRIDRIPKLDIIRELSTISDLHSVDVQFVCKKNEDYHIENLTILENSQRNLDSNFTPNINSIKRSVDYDPSKIIGIDPILGDILFEPDEIPVIRGDWFDRNGIYYSDDIDSNGMKAVNIIKKGKVDSKNRPNT
jgi:hypothetical protein